MEADPAICDRCFGSGMEVVAGKGARRCRCRLEARMKEIIAAIPDKYQGVRLQELKPQTLRHQAQAEAIPFIIDNPLKSLNIWGDNGTGKSLLLWSIFRYAAEVGRPVIGCNVKTLLSEYQLAIAASREGRIFKPRLSAFHLMARGQHWTICLDEFDKPTVSQFVAAELFEVIDAAFNFGHQLVVASNMTPIELEYKWEVEGGRYGKSIVRRITEGAVEIGFPAQKIRSIKRA